MAGTQARRHGGTKGGMITIGDAVFPVEDFRIELAPRGPSPREARADAACARIGEVNASFVMTEVNPGPWMPEADRLAEGAGRAVRVETHHAVRLAFLEPWRDRRLAGALGLEPSWSLLDEIERARAYMDKEHELRANRGTRAAGAQAVRSLPVAARSGGGPAAPGLSFPSPPPSAAPLPAGRGEGGGAEARSLPVAARSGAARSEPSVPSCLRAFVPSERTPHAEG